MRLAGRLEDLALADIFQILSIGKKTGTFIVKGTRGTALIVFKNGLIVRAETDDLEGTVADSLLKAGIIRETMVSMSQEVKKKLPEQPLACILLDLGAVSRDSLDQIIRKRIELGMGRPVMKKWIRWPGLIGFVVVTAAAVALWFIFLDGIVRRVVLLGFDQFLERRSRLDVVVGLEQHVVLERLLHLRLQFECRQLPQPDGPCCSCGVIVSCWPILSCRPGFIMRW